MLKMKSFSIVSFEGKKVFGYVRNVSENSILKLIRTSDPVIRKHSLLLFGINYFQHSLPYGQQSIAVDNGHVVVMRVPMRSKTRRCVFLMNNVDARSSMVLVYGNMVVGYIPCRLVGEIGCITQLNGFSPYLFHNIGSISHRISLFGEYSIGSANHIEQDSVFRLIIRDMWIFRPIARTYAPPFSRHNALIERRLSPIFQIKKK